MAKALKLSISIIGKADPSLGRAIKKAKKDIDGLNKDTVDSINRLGGALKKRNKLLNDRSGFRSQIIGVAGMALAFSAPIRAAVNFESAMADVRKVIDFDSPKQFEALSRRVLDLSRSKAMSAENIARIVEAGAQAGIATEELDRFTESAIKMGVAFDISGAEAGRAMATWRASMGLTQTEAENLSGAINELSNNTNATAPDITRVVTRLGNVAKQAGVSETELAALAATMLSGGEAPEIVSTGLKNMLRAMTRGESATKRQIDAFDELNLNAQEMAELMQHDAPAAIKILMQELQKIDKVKIPAIMSDLFGQEGNIAIAGLVNNYPAFIKALGLANDETKTAESITKEYEVRAATTANQLILFRNKLTAVAITFGSTFLPVLNSTVDVLGSMTTTIGKVAEDFPRLTKFVVLLTGALIFGKVVMLAYRLVAVEFKLVMLGMQIALGKARVAMGLLNITMMANPIGIIIGLVALLAFAIVKLWGPIKSFLGGWWDGFKKGMEPVAPQLAAIGDKISMLFDWFVDLFKPIQNTEEELAEFGAAGEAAGNRVGSAIAGIIGRVTRLLNLIGRVIKAFGQLNLSSRDFGVIKAFKTLVGEEEKPKKLTPIGAGGPRKTTPLPGGIIQQSSGKTTNNITMNISQRPGDSAEAFAETVSGKITNSLSDAGDKAA